MALFNGKSLIWKYYKICSEDNKLAVCLLCKNKISRGGEGKKATTTSLKNHIQKRHAEQYALLSGTLTSASCKISAVPSTSEKKQLTMEETTERKLLWDMNNPKAIKYHYLIGEMIALDNDPVALVERVGFQRLMKHAVPQYKIPCRKYMTEKIIPDIYNRVCSKIEASISQATVVSVTSDMWTCQHNNLSFLSFTAHWISQEFNLQHGVLAMKPFTGSHTGINIAKELNTIAEIWNIQNKIHLLFHDSGANMVKGVRIAEYDSAKCFIHSLQRSVEVSLSSQREVSQMVATARRIVTHFNHSSMAQEKLKFIRQDLKLPNHQLVQDVSTRWNSTYYLMERLLEQKRAVSLYITEHDSIKNLTISQWELMEQCIKFLKPFEEITKITSSGISCISEVISHVVTLLKYLGKEETADRTPNLLTMKTSLKIELESRFKFNEDDKYLVSTFLDPRFKTSFLGLVQTQRAKQKIILESLKINSDESSCTDSSFSPAHKKRNINENYNTEIHDSFWNCFEEVATENMQNGETIEKESSIANEIDFYMKTARLDRTADPYRWWAANRTKYPNLVEFAKIYLSSPGSSVYSERLFSEAGIVYEEKRNRLLSTNAEKIVSIHHNLPLINFKY